jgi:hypothetical protein
MGGGCSEFETTFNVEVVQVVMVKGHPKIKRHEHLYLYYKWQNDYGGDGAGG